MKRSYIAWVAVVAFALLGPSLGRTPIVPRAEALGSISITSAVYAGGGSFQVQGTWEPAGNQCWGPGNEFHFYVEIYDDPDGQLPVTGTVLNSVIPAPCNGDYTDPVDAADRGKGGAWPGPGQGGNTISLSPGLHHVCAVLRHVTLSGNDIAASTCFGQPIGVFVVSKDFVPDSSLSAQVSLSCSAGSVSPANGTASEASPAVFGVVNIGGSETCTATENQPPPGYLPTGPCSAPISTGGCTIVNVAAPSPTPASPPAADPPPSAAGPPPPTATANLPGPLPTATSPAQPLPASTPLPPAAPIEEQPPPAAPGILPPSAGSGGLLPQ